jgi:multidrug efflux pump subunit AcrB
VRQDLGEGGTGTLRALDLRSPSGVYVPLTEVVNLEDRQGFSVIQRRDGRTTSSVTADVDIRGDQQQRDRGRAARRRSAA